MEFQTPSYTIDQLVKWIDTGRLALPEFQREFVWPPSKVVDLLDSVSRGWPVGSVLLLEGPQPFQPKPIDRGPALGGDVRYYVLDGQQRITALYHAVSDVSDIVYLVDFEALAKEGSEDYVTWMKRKQATKEAPTVGDRAARYQAKISEVFDAQKFHFWQSHLPAGKASEATGLRERFISGLKSQVYKLPTIQLVQEIKLEALARIFETVNRNGVRLNAFDLMVAVLYPHQFNLREQWENAQATHPQLKAFDVDGLEVLKLIALRERRAQQGQRQTLTVGGVRQGDVLMVPPSRIRADWERAVAAYVNALELGRKAHGVSGPSLVPADAMLLTLAFALDQGISEVRIREWYWSSVMTQSYSQGANTRVTSDADRLVADDADWRVTVDYSDLESTLAEPVKRNQTLMRGIAGLLVARGARDIVNGTLLSDASAVEPIAIRTLATGQSRLDVNASLAEIAFMTPAGIKKAVSEVRKGRGLHTLFDLGALRGQAFYDEGDEPFAEDWSQERAARLTGWFKGAMEGQ